MITAQEARDIALGLSMESGAFIGGKFVEGRSHRRLTITNPATGAALAEVVECGLPEVDAAVLAARRAFDAGHWSRATPKHRKKVLSRFADLVEQHALELAVLETLNTGKPIRDALGIDIADLVETLRWHAELADKLYDQVIPTPMDVVATATREPIGVVAAVLPWNFPAYLAGWKLAPSLASGNSIILKPAEQTPLTTLMLARLAAEAGVPDGVVNVVPGFGETAGQAIGLHADIDCISFTGSTETGRQFLKYAAASNLKRIVLELGGKSPAIVLPDVKDLRHVAEQVTFGALFCQGQNCSAGSRLIVHESLREPLEEELARTFREWVVGDPLDPATRVGSMVSGEHGRRVLGFIAKGREEGATLKIGGGQVCQELGGTFVEPTLFTDVKNDMAIAREEIFGPVLSQICFSDVDEAVQLANDTRYGLASSLYTNDLNLAHAVSRQIRAGTVSVNCFSEGDTGAPFGGFKESGFGGRDKSTLAHEQYTQVKTTWIQLR